MDTFKHAVRAIAAATVIAAGTSLASQAAGPGGCGQYMYWHDGRCIDARGQGAKSWIDTMKGSSKWW